MTALRACEIGEDITLEVSPYGGVVLTIPVIILDPEYQRVAFEALRAEPRGDVEARTVLSEPLTQAIISGFAMAARAYRADRTHTLDQPQAQRGDE